MKHRRTWLKHVGWGGVVLLLASCGRSGEGDEKTGALAQASTVLDAGIGDIAPPAPTTCQRDPGGYLLSDVCSDPLQGFIQSGPAGSRLGTALAAAGDVNTDGLADVLLGAPGNLSNRGSVYLYQSDVSNVLTQVRRFDGDATLLPQVGSSISFAGSGLFYTAGSNYNSSAGRVYGAPIGAATSIVSLGSAPVRLLGSTSSQTGAAIAAQGNIIGNGSLDLAVGAPTYVGNGAVYVLTGSVTGVIDSINNSNRYAARIQGVANSEFGRAVITADVDGDSRDDLIVGAPGYNGGAGAVFIFFGPLTPPISKDLGLANANVRLDGVAGSRAGAALARVPDVNGDGIDEILVGAPNDNANTGRAYLLYGQARPTPSSLPLSSLPSFTGENPGDRAGAALAAGDVNADGRTDILVGAPGYGGTAGAAYLAYGPEVPFAGETALGGQVRFEGSAGDQAGSALLVPGDMNGDGAADILLGAPGYGGGAGAAYLVYGTLLRVYHHDADHDGYGSPTDTLDACSPPSGYILDDTDCDDSRASISPAATEVCNQIDDNCNGVVDTDVSVPPRWIEDADQDTYGNPFNIVDQCEAPTTGHWVAYVDTAPTECDGTLAEANASDQDRTIHKGAAEICDLKDNDCDSNIDDKESTWYVDVDGDGFGNASYPPISRGCNNQPAGYVQNKEDCNDSNAAINPNTLWYHDVDLDGFGAVADTLRSCTQPAGYVANADDCDDTNNAIKNGLAWYRDADGDGHGFLYDIMRSCTAPAGYVASNDDCNDANGAIHPGQSEVCDNIDNNCSGSVDEGVLNSYYPDVDRDGFGSADPNYVRTGCTLPGGYSINNLDCNDLNAFYNPNTLWHRDADGDGYGSAVTTRSCTQPAGYVLNGTDCDDNDATFRDGKNWYQDSDHDGHGNPNARVYVCIQPAGYVPSADDCNDTRANVYTGAPEVCDNLDNNCNGNVDEGVLLSFYADADHDGFGNMDPNFIRMACTLPPGYVTNNTDCNDLNANINPNTLWYRDADGDSHGDVAVTTASCTRPAGYVASKDDCDDTRSDVYPDAPEFCDPQAPGKTLGASQIDHNCNGSTRDPGKDQAGAPLWWGDYDQDGFARDSFAVYSCLTPTVPGQTPTVDTSAHVFGYYRLASQTLVQDCDDSRDDTYPGATELCDNRDNDCDSSVDEDVKPTYYLDMDNDGCGDPATALTACLFCLDSSAGRWVTYSAPGCK